LSVLVAVAGSFIGASGALAQRGQQPGGQPSGPAPAAPGSPMQPAGANTPAAPAVESKVLLRTETRDLTLIGSLSLRMVRQEDYEQQAIVQRARPFAFATASILFPVIERCASASATGGTKPSATLTIDGKTIPEKLELLKGFPAGTELGKWSFADVEATQIDFRVTLPMRVSRTTYDDKLAESLDWPKEWPEVATSTFKPQWYVDFGPKGPIDMSPVKDLVKTWTRGGDPKALKPAVLAKFLAGEVMKHVQISGNGLASARTGEIEGFALQGAAETAVSKRGSEFDAVCLLAAVYRQAGIPARTVIGYEWSSGRERDKLFSKRGGSDYRAWVEFALVDPATGPGTVVWVPVDIIRMRKSSPQTPALDKPWRYFGTHDELGRIVPIAFQFHPPTDVVSHGSPAFYGWMVTPRPPSFVQQAIRFEVISTPRRADDPQDATPQTQNPSTTTPAQPTTPAAKPPKKKGLGKKDD
jgi:hypothetical protein